MPRQDRNTPHEVGLYKMQEYPATELAAALGFYPAHRDSFDYAHTLKLKDRLAEVCTRCAIRFGLPDQTRNALGDALGLPKNPVLRYPHPEIPMDPRWEALGSALRFPSPGDFPLVHLHVSNARQLQEIKNALPSLLEDLDLRNRPRHESLHQPLFHPIARKVGDKLIGKQHAVKSYGDNDTSPEGYNREIARNMHRQMRIYLAVGCEWTLVNSLESLALFSCTTSQSPSKRPGNHSESRKPTELPLHSKRRNLTGETPLEAPPHVSGFEWMWVRHEGKNLPPTWGGPQKGDWGRWEPRLPDMFMPNQSLLELKAVEVEEAKHLNANAPSAVRRLLKNLHEPIKEFEQTRRDTRQSGDYSEVVESYLRSQLVERQDEVIDAYIESLQP